jgi:DNA mismatch endonuclease (patch repair protein)
MSRVRHRGTKPEALVRRLVSSLGLRYRLHVRDLPGRPDLTFRSRKAVILVHGCFWHQHSCHAGNRTPKSRVAFWRAKLEGNVARDSKAIAKLRRMGWRVMVIWECQLRNTERVERRLRRFLCRGK